MKKKIAATAVLLSLLSISAAGTLAYFIDSDIAHNVITTGDIDIQIVEKQVDPNNSTELIPYPDQPIKGIMPGTPVSKIVSVKNLEHSDDAWIRVMVNITGQLADGTAIMPDQLKVISFEHDETAWEYDEEEGYYYYMKKVGSGESTSPLFEEVLFATDMGNEYQGCTVYIDVTAEAVQADNNGGTYNEIKSWTEVPVAAE